jgi:hypothetical protein
MTTYCLRMLLLLSAVRTVLVRMKYVRTRRMNRSVGDEQYESAQRSARQEAKENVFQTAALNGYRLPSQLLQ